MTVTTIRFDLPTPLETLQVIVVLSKQKPCESGKQFHTVASHAEPPILAEAEMSTPKLPKIDIRPDLSATMLEKGLSQENNSEMLAMICNIVTVTF